jgi:hypothetical protein
MVYIRRRIGKRRSFFRKHRVLLLFLGGAFTCLFALVFVRGVRVPSAPIQFRTPPPVRTPDLVNKFELKPYERAVYPYSVIPGGVRSREELAASISSDRVVAAHYADFKVSQARIIKAKETQFVYVSYRMRDKIFWTSKKVKVPQGETLITDGQETARTRCGNMVSAVPLKPVSDEEPMIETFEIPMTAELKQPPELEPGYQPALQLREFSPLEFIPTQPSILPYYYRPLFVVRSSDVTVPEPGSLSLLIAGLAAFFVVKLARKK